MKRKPVGLGEEIGEEFWGGNTGGLINPLLENDPGLLVNSLAT
jgi:hypothetical protein